ncbi:hypothetical protein U1Q18_037788, partial [Sarracenia purpurea var. burkii]
ANEAKGEGDGFTDTVEIRPNSAVGERIASPLVALEGGAAETVAEKQAEVSVEEEAEKDGAAPIDQVKSPVSVAEDEAEGPAGNAFDSHKQGKPSVDVGLSVGEQHSPDVLWSKKEEETTHAPKVLDGRMTRD